MITMMMMMMLMITLVIIIGIHQNHLFSWVERGTVKIKSLAQKHNIMSPAKARTRIACSGVKRTNHEATAPTDGCRQILKLLGKPSKKNRGSDLRWTCIPSRRKHPYPLPSKLRQL